MKTSPETIASRVRAAKALELRSEGMGFPEIAKELGYNSRQAAHDAVQRALDGVLREPAEKLRTLDLERLDRMWQTHFLQAQAGDVQSLSACLKIMERRARLLGLDAPVQQELSGKGGGPITTRQERDLTDDELKEALARYGLKP